MNVLTRMKPANSGVGHWTDWHGFSVQLAASSKGSDWAYVRFWTPETKGDVIAKAHCSVRDEFANLVREATAGRLDLPILADWIEEREEHFIGLYPVVFEMLRNSRDSND